MFLPQSLQIQTIDYCNRVCAWCPNSYMEKSQENVMGEDIYTVLLHGLKEANYKGSLHLYLMGEPLCDDNLLLRISEARDFFPENTIFISTNGDLLDGEDHIRSLFKAGLTWMGISDYDGDGKFEYAKETKGVVVTPLERLKTTFYNRGGKVDVECTNPYQYCGWVSGKGYINYKGDVILCCSDYDYSVVFGNVMDNSFGEIYNSDKYREYRKAHATGNGKSMKLCKECNRIQ